MRIHTLMYHNIAGDRLTEGSNDPYLVTESSFTEHLRAISSLGHQPALFPNALEGTSQGLLFAFTFDDGGLGALTAADLLETYGWRGHFFIATDFVGTPGFLDAEQIAELRDRGHVIGSHSCSHPPKMSSLPTAILEEEWSRSVAVLSQLLQEPVETASVPGGWYSARVTRAAARSGVKVLFTSEPSSHVRIMSDCAVLGRYSVKGQTNASSVLRLATGSRVECAGQWAAWNARKVPKVLLGRRYNWTRGRILFARGPRQKT